MFELPAFPSTPPSPRRRRRLVGMGHKPGVEQLERRELLDAGLAAGLTNAAVGRLVNSLYNTLLRRAPQPSELASWQNAIHAGQSLDELAQAFLSSPEYQTDFITNSYETLLKRQPQPQEVNGWLQATQTGLSEEKLTAQFLASDEYYQEHGGTPEGWLTGLYWDLFQRTPDAAGFFLWREDLQSGMSRETVALGFVTSPENNTQFVNASYEQFLGRTPDAAGEAGWLAALDGGLSRSQLIAGIIGSPEYASTYSTDSSNLPGNPAATGSPADFNFGPAWSSIPQGSTGVSLTTYSPQTGYGWDSLDGLVVQDTGGITGLDSTFRVDLPNGNYTVTPTLGESTAAHSNMAVWAQGVQELSGLNTAAGQLIAPSFTVQVTNGQLALRFAAQGAGNTFVLDNLDIVPTSPSGGSTSSSPVANDGTVVASSGTTGTTSAAGSAAGISQSNPNGGSASLTPIPSGISGNIGDFLLTSQGHGLTVTINGVPATSPVNVPIKLTSTVSESNPGAATAGFSYIWRVISNNVTVAMATTPSFTFTPSTAGTYSLRLAVTDKYNVTAVAMKTITAANVSLSLSPSSLPSGTVSTAYNATLKATGGSGTYTFAVTSGSLPSGLSLNPNTGVVSGTPTTAGASSFTITATDGHVASLKGIQAYTLTVNPASPVPNPPVSNPPPVSNAATFPNNVNPPPLPSPAGTVINVSTVGQLESAVANLQSGQTILIAPGTYNLTGTLFVPQGLTNIAIRGATGKASDVVIKGDAVFDSSAPYTGSAIWGTGSGITGSILYGIWLGNVQGVTIGDLTLEDFVDHAVIMNAGVQSPLIHNVTMIDTGEQFVKVNPNPSGGGVNNGIIEYCTIEYSTSAPNNYTNGIDLITAQNWTIRNNLFKNILTTNPLTTDLTGPLTGAAVLVWQGSANVTTIDNTFINCQTEIAYGLVAGTTPDNSGGLIADNFIYRSGTQHGDVGISVRNSPNTEVAYNTIIINGDYPNAIEYRFATATGVKILYNLTDAAITQRDGATATVTGNVTNAQSSWFVNDSSGNLNLTSAATGAIDQAAYLSAVPTDYNGLPRPSNGPTDVGAAEYSGSGSSSSTGSNPGSPSNPVSDPVTVTINGAPASSPEGAPISLTSTVTSTSAANTAAGFSYKWTVTKDGAAFASAATPGFSFTPTDHGTYVVTLVAAAQDGSTGTASQTVSVTDVAPLVSINGAPTSSSVGTAISLTSNVFSPSTADNAGGFRYAWSATSNGTAVASGTAANFSFTPASAGTYVVALTVTDSDGATGTESKTISVAAAAPQQPPPQQPPPQQPPPSSPVAPVTSPTISTPYLTIPNFGASPTIYSVASGNWSNPSTWSAGRVPSTGDIVDIEPGTTVTYDVNSTAALNTVEVQNTGTLTFRTDINTGLVVGNFLVLQGGTLVVGTAANPIAANVQANIYLGNQPFMANDPQQFGDGLIVLGNVTMHGSVVTPYVTLAQEAHAGDTVLHLASPVTGWQPGDDPFLPDTRQLTGYGAGGYTYQPEGERVTIQSVSADGLTVYLTAPLKYDHLGARDGKGVLQYLPQLMNDSRNIMVQSESMTGIRGFTLFTDRANVDLEYAGFCELGRSTGQNQADRYAMTMLDLIGPTTPQANGHQFTLIGNEVDNDGDGNAANPTNIWWGIALNNSFYGLIQYNDVSFVSGAGIGVEDAASSYNVFDHNFVANVTGTSVRLDQALQGDGYWFGNPNNYITNNIATDINSSSVNVYSYGFDIDGTGGNTGTQGGGTGTVAVPAAQGDDPSVAGQSTGINMDNIPLLQFSGNEVYGATPAGMTIWYLNSLSDTFYPNAQPSVMKNSVIWHTTEKGFFGYQTNNLTLDGLVILGDFSNLTNPAENTDVLGVVFEDYMTRNLVIQNANIQGTQIGIMAPINVGEGSVSMGTTVIQNSYLDNIYNIEVTPPSNVSNVPLAAQTLNINNVQFANPTSNAFGYTTANIYMNTVTSGALGQPQMSVPQYVDVTNYNGIQGDNFQVFYSQTSSPTGAAPAGATTMADIIGLVLPG